MLPVFCSSFISVPPKVDTYRKSPTATGADITSLSSHFCHRTLPVRSSNAASTWVAPGGAGLLPAAPRDGYEVKTLSPAMVGELVSGSPSHQDQSCLPVAASTENTVHDSVLNTHTPWSHTGLEGPSSSMSIDQTGFPVLAS